VLETLLHPQGTFAHLIRPSAIALLHDLSDRAGLLCNLDGQAVFQAIIRREALGPTALGDGVALPHAQISGLDRPVCLLAQLARPLDFDSPDGRKVDLVAFLLSPETDSTSHLRALALLSRLLSLTHVRAALRGASCDASLWAVAMETGTAAATAWRRRAGQGAGIQQIPGA
jgi:nitrogen PTS system EIIA component